MISIWTILSILVCALVFLVCNIVKKHKLVGTLCLVIMIVMFLNIFTDMAFLGGNGTEYMQWFMSGGDVVETTTQYLTTLLLVFPVFFSLVIYYYTQIYYRTSALLLISLIPCVVYAKIIREIDIKYVMLTIILNVSLFFDK